MVVAPGLVEREASSEEIEAVPGVVTEFEKSRTIRREVTLSTKDVLGGEVGAAVGLDLRPIKVDLSGKVRKAIERETKETLPDTETRRQKVTIDGDKLPKARLVWVDLFKTGMVEVSKDGKTYKVPFEFPYGTKLVVRRK